MHHFAAQMLAADTRHAKMLRMFDEYGTKESLDSLLKVKKNLQRGENIYQTN